MSVRKSVLHVRNKKGGAGGSAVSPKTFVTPLPNDWLDKAEAGSTSNP